MNNTPRLACAAIVIGLVTASGPAHVGPASAGDAVRLTGFLMRYLEADDGLQASRLRVEASETNMKARRYLAAPGLQLSLTAPRYSWNRVYYPLYNEADGTTYEGYYESELRSQLMSLTLRQPLPTGGDLSVTGSASKRRSEFSTEGFPSDATYSRETGDEEVATDLGLSLDQPLFGFLERRSEVRKAALEHKIKIAQHKIDCAGSVKKAVNIFFDYVVGGENLKVEELRLDRAVEEAQAAIKQFAEFLIPETEVLEKQVAANDARIKHLEARSAFDKALRRLRVVQPSGPADLIPEDLGEIVPVNPGSGRGPSPGVLRAGHDVEVAKIVLADTRRRRYGRPAVSLSYGFQGVGDDLREARDEFGRSRWGGSLSLGFTFPEPGLSADIDLARAALKAAESAHEEAIQAAVEERSRLVQRIDALRAKLELETRQVELLAQVTGAKRTQYEEDVISLDDLVDAETDLLNARIARLETLRKINLAWVDLVLATGGNPVEVLSIKE